MLNSIDSSVLIGLAGLAIAVIQIIFNRRRAKSEETFRVIEKLNSPDAREARFAVSDLICKAVNHHEQFDSLSDRERSDLSSVAATFGYVGILGKRGKVDLPLIVDLWGDAVVSNWEKLSPYREYLESRFGKPVGHWEYFEWLSNRATNQRK